MKFKQHEIVSHVLSKDDLMIIDYTNDKTGTPMYKCRTKTHQLINFYEFELNKK